MRTRSPQAEAALPGSVFELTRPVIDVEVSLLAAPGAHIDWVRSDHRDEAIRAIVERSASLFESEIKGRVEHVRHSNFNSHGMTVHITIAAPDTPHVAEVVTSQLGALERSLEARLQVHFGWEQAAVSVQIESHPEYLARMGAGKTNVSHGNDIAVFQPPGGSNAIAPVIVTVPMAQFDRPPHLIYPTPPVVPEPRGSNAIAALIGGLVVIGVAIFVALAIGPLTDRIGALYEWNSNSTQRHAHQIDLKNQQIRSLTQENGRLQRTVWSLASRRGRPALRGDQPTRALPDTDQVGIGPLAETAPSASRSAVGAP